MSATPESQKRRKRKEKERKEEERKERKRKGEKKNTRLWNFEKLGRLWLLWLLENSATTTLEVS